MQCTASYIFICKFPFFSFCLQIVLFSIYETVQIKVSVGTIESSKKLGHDNFFRRYASRPYNQDR